MNDRLSPHHRAGPSSARHRPRPHPLRNSALLGALLFTSSALASPLIPFNPGGSPCEDNCPLSWAAPAFEVPFGTPEPLLLPEGAIFQGVSYARNGVPAIDPRTFVTHRPHLGQGYYLSPTTIMFQFSECRNWAVVELGRVEPLAPPHSHSHSHSGPVGPVVPTLVNWPDGPNWPGKPDEPGEPWEPEEPEEPETPALIPLPASAILLLLALASFPLLVLFLRKPTRSDHLDQMGDHTDEK